MNITLCPKYKPLFNTDTRYICVSGGRASGKSFATSLWLAMRFAKSKKNALYLREYMSNAGISIIPEFLKKVEMCGFNFLVRRSEVINQYGAKLYFRGFKSGSSFADSSLKSLTELETVLIEEATEVHEEEFTKLDFSLRDKDADVKIALAYNPSSIHHWLYNFEQRESVTKIHTTFLDNEEHLGKSFLEESEAMKKRDFRKWQNVFMGEWIDFEAKALFTADDVRKAQRENTAKPVYTVVAIDPAVSVNATSDETGICAASKMEDGTFCVHRCIAEKWTPGEWAEKAVELFDKYDADELVYESNQGGLLVEQNLRNVRSTLPISSVRATKGKVLRAEPIVTLYEQEKVTHEPGCEALEQEMVTFTGSKGEKSPNMLDAMVWALTSLKSHKEFALQWG